MQNCSIIYLYILEWRIILVQHVNFKYEGNNTVYHDAHAYNPHSHLNSTNLFTYNKRIEELYYTAVYMHILTIYY